MSEKEDHLNDDRIDFSTLYKQRKETIGPDCLTVEALDAYIHGTESNEQLQASERHLQQCDRCSVELEYRRAFEFSNPPPNARMADIAAIEDKLRTQAKAFVTDRFKDSVREEAAVKVLPYQKRSFPTRLAWRLAAMAASLVLAFGFIYYGTREPHLPGGSGSDEYSVRGRPIELLFPLGRLSDAPRYLSWKPVPGVVRYTVRITEVDATLVWNETVSTEKVYLPIDISAKLIRTKTYYWYVEAQTDARTLVRSDRGSFVIELAQRKPP